jgi:hypothetical protein
MLRRLLATREQTHTQEPKLLTRKEPFGNDESVKQNLEIIREVGEEQRARNATSYQDRDARRLLRHRPHPERHPRPATASRPGAAQSGQGWGMGDVAPPQPHDLAAAE